MYGYSIPRYAQQYLAEWRREDPDLRLRRSMDLYGAYILERKTVYKHPPHEGFVERGSDRAIQLKDGYRLVFRFWADEIQWVARSLALTDIHRLGGAKALENRLSEGEDKVEQLLDRAYRADCEAAASELFDRLAWEEKRRVSLAGTKPQL